MENLEHRKVFRKITHACSYHPRTSTALIHVFFYEEDLKKEFNVEPYQRSLNLKYQNPTTNNNKNETKLEARLN